MPVSGIVTAEREALVRLVVLGPEDPGTSAEIEAVLDTGFTGHLTLPPEVIGELGLPLLGSRNSVLADGGRVALDVHRARVLYLGLPGEPECRGGRRGNHRTALTSATLRGPCQIVMRRDLRGGCAEPPIR